MNRFALALGLLVASSTLSLGAFAQERGGDRGGDHRDERRDDHRDDHGSPPQNRAPPAQQQHMQPSPPQQSTIHHGPVRQPPPQWQAHAPGPYPQGPRYQYRPVRVLAPRVVVRGRGGWNHWEHPEFNRPVYYWHWEHVRYVSCIAEDSYGDQYPVSERAWGGFGLDDMTTVEDNALDRCYAESGNDDSCYLATCSHY